MPLSGKLNCTEIYILKPTEVECLPRVIWKSWKSWKATNLLNLFNLSNNKFWNCFIFVYFTYWIFYDTAIKKKKNIKTGWFWQQINLFMLSIRFSALFLEFLSLYDTVMGHYSLRRRLKSWLACQAEIWITAPSTLTH